MSHLPLSLMNRLNNEIESAISKRWMLCFQKIASDYLDKINICAVSKQRQHRTGSNPMFRERYRNIRHVRVMKLGDKLYTIYKDPTVVRK